MLPARTPKTTIPNQLSSPTTIENGICKWWTATQTAEGREGKEQQRNTIYNINYSRKLEASRTKRKLNLQTNHRHVPSETTYFLFITWIAQTTQDRLASCSHPHNLEFRISILATVAGGKGMCESECNSRVKC